MSFNYLTREPLHFARHQMFLTDDNVYSTCEAKFLSLCVQNGAWVVEMNERGPVYTPQIGNELHELKLELLTEWGGTGFNPELFEKWLLSEYVISMDRPSYRRSYVESEIAMYLIEIMVDNSNEAKLVQVDITAFNKDFVTDNATASRLIDAHKETQELCSYVRDLAFAKAVCADLLQNLGDAPAIQKRLRASIAHLDKLISG